VLAVAALNNVELITALILQPTARPRSLQLRILNAVVSLFTTEVHNKALAAFLASRVARGKVTARLLWLLLAGSSYAVKPQGTPPTLELAAQEPFDVLIADIGSLIKPAMHS
jgi:hypothetical protein